MSISDQYLARVTASWRASVIVAIGQEFATEEHSLIAQGVADHEPPVSQPEHQAIEPS